MKYERVSAQPENPFSKLIPDQSIAIIPSFTLESGVVLQNVPVAYSTKGKLSPQRDNALVICHALSGSADVSDWWGPLLGGPGKAFDITRFLVICINSLGSPYGTASPVTIKSGGPEQRHYGPEFPLTTIRDDVRLSKLLLDDLGVTQVAAVVGGSMGGMLVLEFAYFGKDYVRSIVPIATSAKHSAWCISWGEAQRQSIYSDPKYGKVGLLAKDTAFNTWLTCAKEDGYYPFDDPPATGLGAARMAALLTYRSRDSFEARFGRNIPDPARQKNVAAASRPMSPLNEHFEIHNEGHKNAGSPRQSISNGSVDNGPATLNQQFGLYPSEGEMISFTDPQFKGATPLQAAVVPSSTGKRATTYFSAQSYLRYQGDKFIKRFDANCYIAITRKLDTHDVSVHCKNPDSADPLHEALSLIQQPALVLGIKSDGLFTFAEQQEIARGIPNSRLETIDSPEGHDAFLLQFEQVNKYILDFFSQALSHILEREPIRLDDLSGMDLNGDGSITKNSTFGEAEVEDITAW